MAKTTTERRHYQVLPDGRAFITGAQLKVIAADDPGRILDADLRSRPARVLLLDKPFQLGARVDGSGDAFLLLRISLRELPGWPPRLAASVLDKPPPLAECRVMAARFRGANTAGQEGLECDLSHKGMGHTAWLVGCPLPLLRCALMTFQEPGVLGNRIADLQDIRLVGDGKTA